MLLNKKNKLLLLGFILSLHICYSFAFSNTLSYYKEYKAKIDSLINLDNTTTDLPQLQSKEKQLDLLLTKNKLSGNDFFQNELLKSINSNAIKYQLKIIDFKEPHSFTENNQIIVSYPFTLKGSYNGTMALLNSMENNRTFGIIKHLNFIKKKNYKTNVDELLTEIILERTTPIPHSK